MQKIYGDLQLMGPGKILGMKLEELAALPTPSVNILNQFFVYAEEGQPKKIAWYDGTDFQYIAVGDVDLSGVVRADGSVSMTGDLILSSADQSESDAEAAVSKGYMDSLLAGKAPLVTYEFNRALVTNGAGAPADSTTTATEIGYLSGVTSAVQSQLDGKQASLGYTPINQAGDSMFGNLNMNGSEIVGLPAPTTANSAARRIDLENAIAGMNWQADVLGIAVDATLDPGATPSLGDRYIIVDADAVNANFGTISGLGDGDIVQYDGTQFQVAFDIAAQGDNAIGTMTTNQADGMFWRHNGTAWFVFEGAEPVVSGDGIDKVGNVLNVLTGPAIFINGDNQVALDYRANSGLFTTLDGATESADELAKLAVRLGTGMAFDVDGSVIIGSQGVTAANLGAVIGDGLAGAEGSVITVQASDGITVGPDGVSVSTTYLNGLYARLGGAAFTGAITVIEPTTDNNPVRKIDLDNAIGLLEGVQTYFYETTTPLTVHEIPHNLGQQYPNYTLTDDQDEVIGAQEIKFIDANNMRVTTNIAANIRLTLRSQP
jgi:hypothetical protein